MIESLWLVRACMRRGSGVRARVSMYVCVCFQIAKYNLDRVRTPCQFVRGDIYICFECVYIRQFRIALGPLAFFLPLSLSLSFLHSTKRIDFLLYILF